MDFTDQQIASMEQRFVTDPFLRGEDLDAFADELTLTRNQVRAWFIDRRRRMRAVQQPEQQQQQQAQPDLNPAQQARRPGMAFLDNLLQDQNDMVQAQHMAALIRARQAHDLRMQQMQQAHPGMQQPLQLLQRNPHPQQRLPPIIFPQQNLLQQPAAAQDQQDQRAVAPLLQPPQPLQQPPEQQLQLQQLQQDEPVMDKPNKANDINVWKYCRICSTEDYSIPRALIIPCGHVACTGCVAKVVEANEGCTFCKQNIHSTKRLFE